VVHIKCGALGDRGKLLNHHGHVNEKNKVTANHVRHLPALHDKSGSYDMTFAQTHKTKNENSALVTQKR